MKSKPHEDLSPVYRYMQTDTSSKHRRRQLCVLGAATNELSLLLPSPWALSSSLSLSLSHSLSLLSLFLPSLSRATCISSGINAALDVQQQQFLIMQQRRSIPGRLGYGIKYVTLCLYSDGCTTHHAANYLSIFRHQQYVSCNEKYD